MKDLLWQDGSRTEYRRCDDKQGGRDTIMILAGGVSVGFIRREGAGFQPCDDTALMWNFKPHRTDTITASLVQIIEAGKRRAVLLSSMEN